MEKIGRYAVIGELGRGAMGVVYRAQDPAIGRTVAIKTIRLSDFTDPAERDRLKDRLFREAQSAGILSHPGIVTIYDIAEDGHLAYIFMEFVNGPSLDKILSEPKPPAREAIISVWRQTAAALDYAHKKGIVHRDIKPANIMLHEDGTAKITDFGIAKIVSQNMTQAGTMMGTPSYMSPEQVQGKPVDGRADQFALAVIAYEMLTGEKPFVAEYLPTLLYKLVAEEPAAPQRLNPTLAAEVEAVLRKGLGKKPEDRYSTCSEFILSLEEACAIKPDWKPLSTGQSQNMPTVAKTAEELVAPQPEPAIAVQRPAPRKPKRLEDDEEDRKVIPLPPPPVPKPVVAHETTIPAPAFAAAANSEAGDEPGRKGWKIALGLVLGLVAVGAILGLARNFFVPQDKTAAQATQTIEKSPVEGAPATPAPPPIARPSPASTPVEPPQSTPTEIAQPAVETPKPPVERRQSAPTEKFVEITTTPSGAAIVFDGNPSLTCTSPCAFALLPGRHTIQATVQGFRVARRIFELPQQPSMNLVLEKEAGLLTVTSTPPGATIFINGQEHPQKTPAMIPLAVGKYKIAIVKEGFPRDEGDVDVRDGRTATLNVELQRNP